MGTYSVLFGGIVNTKHNLSVSNISTDPDVIKATTQGQICVFCHIPHDAQVGKPLWNRSMPTSAYNMYTSDYLKRGGYPLPTELGSTDDTPGTLSRQCMSCHDGTVAVGSVYLLNGTILGSALINMTGVDGSGMIPATATTNFGTNLINHHPVGVEYDPALFALTDDFDTGTKLAELKATPDAPIKLYNYAGKNYVECTSCHDPHLENGKFLRVNVGSHGVNINTTCNSCHDKDSWSGSAHQASTGLYTDTAVSTDYGTDKVSDLGCINCHTPHNGEGAPYLLRKVEQNTCFQGAASATGTAPCHGTGNSTGTTNDIESQLTKVFSHPVITTDGVHTNLDTIYGTGVTDPNGGKGVEWGDAKHAECMDCHNQHKATPGTHTPVNQWYPTTTSSTTNAVSNALSGASGVEPSWPTSWTQPTGFTTLESATKEYQICMKCHSSWGLGTAPEGVSMYPLANELINATDQAFEFNPKNRSAHPVVMTTNEMDALGGNGGNDPLLEGRYAPTLTVNALKTPWNNTGNQTMYCSDCHGANSESTTDPKGPHGSSNNFMLKGEATNWPDNGGTLFTMDDGQATTATSNPLGIFCLNCHVYEPGDGTISVHSTTRSKMRTAACVNCHVAVPHGSKVSRLIGYTNMPEPYNYLGNSLKLEGFRQESASSSDLGNLNLNAYSIDGSCTGGQCHSTQDGTSYDGW